MKIDNVKQAYSQIKSDAFKLFQRGEFDETLNYISTLAHWAYMYNFIYTDADLEELLRKCALKISTEYISSSNKDRVILFDTCGFDNRGLIQIYVRALIENNYDFLLIYNDKLSNIPVTSREIEKYGRGKILSFNEETISKKIELVLSEIRTFNPSKILLDIVPWDVMSLACSSLVKNCKVFNINGTDHAFWLGTTILDYNLEFRRFGYTISIEKRGLKKEQLILNSYYPILNGKIDKDDLPKFTSNTIKLLTGGASYKFLGNKLYFFQIVDILLESCDSAILMIAGYVDDILKESVSKMKHKKRVYFIGVRKDIDLVFEYCDIYLNSYPFGGGLMTQLAAVNKKPILSLIDEYNEHFSYIDECVFPYGDKLYSKHNVDELVSYFKSLTGSHVFRKSEGESLCNGIVTVSNFNKKLKKILEGEIEKMEDFRDVVDYDSFLRYYLEVEDEYPQSFGILLYRYRLKAFVKFPYFFKYFAKICIVTIKFCYCNLWSIFGVKCVLLLNL